MKECILLDNQLTSSIFSNPNLVEDQKIVSAPLELSTNAGELITYKKSNVPGYGDVWFDERAITNIFSFAEMEDKYRITYDSWKEKAFVVNMPYKQVKFARSTNGLYYFKPSYSTGNSVSLVETVAENSQHYTKQQVECAKQARA